MNIRYSFASLLLAICPTLSGFSQVSIKDSTINATLIYATYSYQIPGGDLKDRFGNNSNIGGGALFKSKGNWLIGAEANYLFGEKIKNDGNVLGGIVTKEGYVIDANGTYTEVRMYERGFWAGGKLGKLFPIFGPNPNSGIALILGGGYLQHKIRIEDKNNAAPQLKKKYLKGYDRLTDGYGINGFLGYFYLGNRKILSFYGGIEYTIAWTKSVRGYNFDAMEYDTKNRIDKLTGIKIGWIIPLYQQAPAKFYYY